MTTTHAAWWLDEFCRGNIGPRGLYLGADLVSYGEGVDVLRYCDGSTLTVPEDGPAFTNDPQPTTH